MKKSLVAIMLAAAPLVFHSAFAATDQQNKMTSCNKDAGDKKGDERKAFMKECLSNKPKAAAADAKTSQQEKMKSCNVSAKGMKGDERKKFMSDCLKKD
jgi:hypothetical protein